MKRLNTISVVEPEFKVVIDLSEQLLLTGTKSLYTTKRVTQLLFISIYTPVPNMQSHTKDLSQVVSIKKYGIREVTLKSIRLWEHL